MAMVGLAALPALPQPSALAQAARERSTRNPNSKAQPVTIDADRMERFCKESLVVFTGSVVARQDNSVQYTDRMEVYLDDKGDRILRTVSTGGVRIITRDCRTGTAKRAEYFDLEQRLVLIDGARVWEADNVVSGDTITIFLSQDRSVVQGGKQERVKAVFYPKDEKSAGAGASADAKKDPETAAKPTAPCVN